MSFAMASKIKNGLSEAKPSLRVSKLNRLVTKPEPNTPSQRPRLSFDRSTCTDKRSPKLPTPPQRTQFVRVSELIKFKEELNKANEVIASLENEKAKTFNEIQEAKKEAKYASGKLVEALKALKETEYSSAKLLEALKARKEAEKGFESEKFEAVEAMVESKRELEDVKHQHALDLDALFLVTRELEKVNQELLVSSKDEKSKSMSRADDVNKMALIHEEKVEILSSELIRLKALLESTREKETISNKEIMALKKDLENAKSFEAEAKERDMIIKKLHVDLEAAESFADDWQNRAEEVERASSVSLESVKKHLQERKESLRDKDSEITELKKKIRLLETTVVKQKKDLEISKQRQEEAERLKNELLTVNVDKNRSLKKEKEATSFIQKLVEEKQRILLELESSKEEEEKSKKAMKRLQEVSSDKDYEVMLEEARHEIDVLVNTVEQTKKQFESSMIEWEMRETGLVNHVKRFEEEVSTMGKEMNRLCNLLKRKKEEAEAAWKKESEMKESLKEVEDEVISLQETLRDVQGESFKLKKKVLDKEIEFQNVVHENDVLRAKEEESMKKIDELKKLLEEALDDESDEEYDFLPKVVEFSSENGHRSAEEKVEKEESFEEEEEHSNVIDESKKAEETGNGLIGEDDELMKEKMKKKVTLFGKVGNLLKKKGSFRSEIN